MILKTPLGEWMKDNNTNGICIFYKLDDKVFEYVVYESTDASSVTTATESDENDTDGEAQSMVVDTSNEHWNVYIKQGSTLTHSSQCAFDDFDPTQVVPIHITKLSNSKLGFESTSMSEIAIPQQLDPASSTFNDLLAIQPKYIQELL